ncbi:MAG: hypothetical protein ACTHQ3_01615 [Motilibacteraceae bacterium]
MSEEKTTGMDRRTVLRRGALLGGALVWSTPVVQSLGGTALAATGTPAGGGGEVCADISYVIVVVKCDGKYYAYKMSKDNVYDPEWIKKTQGDGSDVALANALKQSSDGDITGMLQQAKPATDLVTATGNANGDLVIQVNGIGCTIVTYVIHDGVVHGSGTLSHNYAYGDALLPSSGWQYPASLPVSSATFVKPGVSADMTCTAPTTTA